MNTRAALRRAPFTTAPKSACGTSGGLSVLAAARGGPDPGRPCEGCSLRAGCRAPCELLAPLVGREELVASNEVSSPALMEGRGYDEGFMTLHEALRDERDPGTDRWPAFVAAFAPRIREVLPELPLAQREVVQLLLAGKTRAEITRIRDTRRQVTHKLLHCALRTLARRLGPLPDRGDAPAKG